MRTMLKTWTGKLLLPLMLASFVCFFGCEQDLKAQKLDQKAVDKEFVEMDELPAPTNLSQIYHEIGYPKAAREQNIQGVVIAKILVDENGGYVEHEIIKSEHKILQEAVEPHLSKLIFNPGIKEGEAVKAWVQLPVRFAFKE
ncbi:MAG: energy transducer TonB [Bacteroidia bacterium]|nr:energy transducer TonB [Bacteroidia bacterium]